MRLARSPATGIPARRARPGRACGGQAPVRGGRILPRARTPGSLFMANKERGTTGSGGRRAYPFQG